MKTVSKSKTLKCYKLTTKNVQAKTVKLNVQKDEYGASLLIFEDETMLSIPLEAVIDVIKAAYTAYNKED